MSERGTWAHEPIIIWSMSGFSTWVPKWTCCRPGCSWRVVMMSFNAAALECEGSPIGVPGMRGMSAMSVVGMMILLVVIDYVAADGLLAMPKGLLFQSNGRLS